MWNPGWNPGSNALRLRDSTLILDFHTHLGDILPNYRGIRINIPSPAPHYLMISSRSIEDPERLFYRKRPRPFSFGFLKHVVITLQRRKQTFQGMVISNLLSDMYSNNITRSVVLPIEYHDGIERSLQLIEECRDAPHLIPFCSVHPKDPLSIKKMHKYMQMGAKGLKLHPNFQQMRPNDRELFPLYTEYAAYRLPLILHSGLTGQESRFRFGSKFSSLEFIETIPKNFPEMPVVLAHAGISQYQQAISLAQKYENVYLELSGQPTRHICQALSNLGSERLLFGTDWPFWNQSLALQAVRQAARGDQIVEQRILYKNAERLLQLGTD